jgi:hypothetical protein
MGRMKMLSGRIQGSWGRINKNKEIMTEGKPLHAEKCNIYPFQRSKYFTLTRYNIKNFYILFRQWICV